LQLRRFPRTDGVEESLGPFPFPTRGLVIINRTDVDVFLIDDNGLEFFCPPSVIATWGAGNTTRFRFSSAGAVTNGEHCTVIVTDEPTANSTSQLANLSGGSGGGSVAATGDYKVSAQPATHSDATGTWYLCDGTALPAGETALIALIGANTPDAPGRSLVMKGTHADVNNIGDSEGLAVADRRPKHNTAIVVGSISTQGSSRSDQDGSGPGPGGNAFGSGNSLARADNTLGDFSGFRALSVTATAAGGSGGSDQGAYIVPGNLFVHS